MAFSFPPAFARRTFNYASYGFSSGVPCFLRASFRQDDRIWLSHGGQPVLAADIQGSRPQSVRELPSIAFAACTSCRQAATLPDRSSPCSWPRPKSCGPLVRNRAQSDVVPGGRPRATWHILCQELIWGSRAVPQRQRRSQPHVRVSELRVMCVGELAGTCLPSGAMSCLARSTGPRHNEHCRGLYEVADSRRCYWGESSYARRAGRLMQCLHCLPATCQCPLMSQRTYTDRGGASCHPLSADCYNLESVLRPGTWESCRACRAETCVCCLAALNCTGRHVWRPPC